MTTQEPQKETVKEPDEIKEVIFLDRTPASTTIRDLEGFTLFTFTKDLLPHLGTYFFDVSSAPMDATDLDKAWLRLNAWLDRFVLCANSLRHVQTDVLQKRDFVMDMIAASYQARLALKKVGRLSKIEERIADAEKRQAERLKGKINEGPGSDKKDEVQSH